ncbi:MAG: hypothetical protein HUU16_20285, partial [Candidatus Omnitrophica bacterium]|nr:hypothetical protein [Candidatus Omnitrophota bacterium]
QIVLAGATAVERRVANLLRDRWTEISPLPVRVEVEDVSSTVGDQELLVLLGIPRNHGEISREFDLQRIKPLSEADPGPEGFLLKTLPRGNAQVLLAAGVDERGVLYAVGEILRRAKVTESSLLFPIPTEKRNAPAFEIRGTQFGQSSVAKRLGRVRDWTDAETQRVILDYALAGANVFSTETGLMFDFIKSYGLMTQGGLGPNTGSGPPEWQAKESIGRTGYLCPSVPEARAALLKKCEDYFKSGPTFDLVKFHGGDGGGCECDKCDPYGKTFIHLVEDMAAIVHKYHPESRVYFTNQKFDDDDDRAIFEYLREKPRTWLWAFGYGPGSDAMSWQPGHRQTHRMDLFRYPGFGPFGRYCQEIVHQLPPEQVLVFYNEITHWRYSQHGYVQMYPRADRNGDLPPRWNHFIYERRPDQALTMVYDRLTFFAWPRFYHWVFNQLLRFGVGDITHSSGSHDHFNQWMWQRLLWAPQTSVEDVVAEYCRTWFGEAAAPPMAEAIFQLEKNLEEIPGQPITEKEGIDRYYRLVKQAGERMPALLLKGNWLWREYMQKAALDKCIQLKVAQQTDLEARIEKRVAEGFEAGDLKAAAVEALTWFDTLAETEEMKALRGEATRLGEESNTLFGVRSEGIYNLEHDYIGLGWLKRQLERARDASGNDQRELLWAVIHYEDAGEGGFYDNCGTYNPAPNLVRGYPYDHGQPYVSGMFSEGNRPSQRSMSFTQDEEQGVALHYRGLDPNASYRIRLTLSRPWYQERYAAWMNQKSQRIEADGIPIAEEQELPLQMSDFFTYKIPPEAIRDGELVIQLRKAQGVAEGDRVSREIWRNSGGWGTLLAEAWLMREDRLPWLP